MKGRILQARRLAALATAVAVFGVTCSVATATTLGSGGHRRANAAPILVGNISTITNPVISAKDLVDGTRAWIGYINNHGGIHGRKIKLVTCDDQSNPALTVQCANNLIQQGVVALVGSWSLTLGASALPALQQARIPILGGWPITDQEYQSPVEFPVTAGAAGSYPVLALAMRAAGAKNLAGIWFNSPASVGVSQSVTDLWPTIGGGYYKPTYFNPAAPDYTPTAAVAVGSGADGLFLALTGAQAPRMLQAVKAAGFSGVLGMTGLAALPSVMVQAGTNLDGTYLTFPGVAITRASKDLKLFISVMGKAHVPADALSETGAAGAQYMWDVLNSIKGKITAVSVLAAARKHTTWKGFLTHSMSPKFAPSQYPSIRNPYNVVVQYIGKGKMKQVKVKNYPKYTSVENGAYYIEAFPH